MRHALVLLVMLAGCPDDDPPPIDAATTTDAPAAVCTGQLYDLCTGNTQCMSGNCRMFNNLGVMLCTQACTAGGTACPDQNGAAVPCSSGGSSSVCRPAAANSCTPQP